VRFQDGAGLAWSDSELTKELWRTSGVHSADINGTPALHAEKKPQNDNDLH